MTELEEDIYYLDLLEQWFQRERAAGRLIDVKFFPGDGAKLGHAKAAYEILTGKEEGHPIDTSDL